MEETQESPIPWNAEAHIACAISFQCPQMWDRLGCTADPFVRHCFTCDKSVHLAMTEEDFNRYRRQGICVAVPIVPDPGESQTRLIIGDFERDGPEI